MNTQAPNFVKVEHLEYLDDLRESGEVNMFASVPYLVREFPELSSKEGSLVLAHWMQCFSV